MFKRFTSESHRCLSVVYTFIYRSVKDFVIHKNTLVRFKVKLMVEIACASKTETDASSERQTLC